MRKNITRPMYLYWGGRRLVDLYLDEEARGWQSKLPLHYIPVLSRSQPDDYWTGRIGHVHHAVMHDVPDLSGYQVYACGSPAMVDAARADFSSKCGLPDNEFFADSFLTSADKAEFAA